jgi:hypothetical protein
MNNTLTASDVRAVLKGLDRIKVLTELLRHAHLSVPAELVFGAIGAEATIRQTLLTVAVSAIEVEPVSLALAAE